MPSTAPKPARGRILGTSGSPFPRRSRPSRLSSGAGSRPRLRAGRTITRTRRGISATSTLFPFSASWCRRRCAPSTSSASLPRSCRRSRLRGIRFSASSPASSATPSHWTSSPRILAGISAAPCRLSQE